MMNPPKPLPAKCWCARTCSRARVGTGKAGRQIAFRHLRTNRAGRAIAGPIFVRRDPRMKVAIPTVAATTWRFNGWAKYTDWRLDAPVSAEMAERLQVRVAADQYDERPSEASRAGRWQHRRQRRGTLITTEECLLSGVSSAIRDHAPAAGAGFRRLSWREEGDLAGARHRRRRHSRARRRHYPLRQTVDGVTAYEPDRSDPNHGPLSENFRRLQKTTDQSGNRLRGREAADAGSSVFRGQRLPASYANFYIANKLVLVPIFSDPNDRIALNTLAELFPSREVVGIYCRDFIWGLGALHCMTQQQPAG